MAARIPIQYIPIVKDSLFAATAAPSIVFSSSLDVIAISDIWTATFEALRNKAGCSLGTDPKRICVAVATGVAIHCNNKFFINILVALSVLMEGTFISSDIVKKNTNLFFTYSFAATLIELLEKPIYNDDDIITFFVNHLKKLPNAEEVKEIIKIYRS